MKRNPPGRTPRPHTPTLAGVLPEPPRGPRLAEARQSTNGGLSDAVLARAGVTRNQANAVVGRYRLRGAGGGQ